MINWISVISNSLWIFGLSLLLAALSYYYWLAQQQAVALRTILNQTPFLRTYWAGMAFIGAGLAGTSRHLWEIAIWLTFTLFALISLLRLTRQTTGSKSQASGTPDR